MIKIFDKTWSFIKPWCQRELWPLMRHKGGGAKATHIQWHMERYFEVIIVDDQSVVNVIGN